MTGNKYVLKCQQAKVLDGMYYSNPMRTIRKLLIQIKLKDAEAKDTRLKLDALHNAIKNNSMKDIEILELRNSVNLLSAEKSKWVRQQKRETAV